MVICIITYFILVLFIMLDLEDDHAYDYSINGYIIVVATDGLREQVAEDQSVQRK